MKGNERRMDGFCNGATHWPPGRALAARKQWTAPATGRLPATDCVPAAWRAAQANRTGILAGFINRRSFSASAM